MLLYHFTSHANLAEIIEAGLSRGDVPTGPGVGLQAVNLTSDGSPDGHGLDKAGHVWTEEESRKVLASEGVWIPPGTVNENKRAVRLTVKVKSSDRNLKRWLHWARKNVDADYLAQIHRVAGKQGTWFLYFGTIPPSAITAVDVIDPA